MTKTKDEKVMQGTHRPSRDRVPVPYEILTAVPPPMYKLSAVSLRYYETCCRILISQGTLTAGDVLGITRAATTYGIYQKALKDVEKYGSHQTTRTGYTTKSGYFQVANDCEKMLMSFERTQGLNLVSRSKLPEPPAPKSVNPFDTV